MSKPANTRYAAFAKKHGLIDHRQPLPPHSLPESAFVSPTKVNATPDHVFVGAHAERWAQAPATDEFAAYVITKSPFPHLSTPISSTPSNLRKRPAAPESSSVTELRRSESPVKLSRTSNKRFGSGGAATRPFRQGTAEFLSAAQVPPSSTSGPVQADADVANVNSRQQPEVSVGSQRHDLPPQADVYDVAAQLRRQKLDAETPAFILQEQQATPEKVLLPRMFTATPSNAESQDFDEDFGDYENPINTSLDKQPESRPITQEQLTAEVKAIYAGLVIVEAKCINVVNTQSAVIAQARGGPRLDPQHWQAMITLHRTLLHEHHDFLLASQHPVAGQPLKNLALKHSMPARMWKHGIHNFLELLRRCLPQSLDFMLSFIYLAYQMIALLFETVPSFEDTWIECLGDLSRYRMAIEDEDQGDRDIWTGVARFWYSKAADKNPGIGRLYHHLAILARSQAVQQLSLYCRSLTTLQIFPSARDSVMTLFEPILARSTSSGSRPLSVESWFIRCHALIFTNALPDALSNAIHNFLAQLDSHITRLESKWKLQGVYMAIANIAGLLSYGTPTSAFRGLFNGEGRGVSPHVATQTSRLAWKTTGFLDEKKEQSPPEPTRCYSSQEWYLAFSTFLVPLNRTGNDDVLPHIHVMLVFLWRLSLVPHEAEHLNSCVPWAAISRQLNSLLMFGKSYPLIQGPAFPTPEKGDRQPLPEDFLIRGLVWSQEYFPKDWFECGSSDEDERMKEFPSTTTLRAERILWLGVRLASHNRWLQYDPSTQVFAVRDPSIALDPTPQPQSLNLPLHPPRKNSPAYLETKIVDLEML